MPKPIKELDILATRGSLALVKSMQELTRALVSKNRNRINKAKERLQKDVVGTWTMAFMLGQGALMKMAMPRQFAEVAEAPVEVAPFVLEDALEALFKRIPVLAIGFKRVQEAINNDKRVIAFARSTTIEVTQRTQKALGDLAAQGVSVPTGSKVLAEMNNWTEAYAENVFRTNMNTAFTRGMFEKAKDPDVEDLIPAFVFVATKDRDTRKNHLAADGVIARPDDPIWKKIMTPLGYMCRCSVRILTRAEHRALFDGKRVPNAKLPAGAHPDPGFNTAA